MLAHRRSPTLRPLHLDQLHQAQWSFSTQEDRGHSTTLPTFPSWYVSEIYTGSCFLYHRHFVQNVWQYQQYDAENLSLTADMLTHDFRGILMKIGLVVVSQLCSAATVEDNKCFHDYMIHYCCRKPKTSVPNIYHFLVLWLCSHLCFTTYEVIIMSLF